MPDFSFKFFILLMMNFHIFESIEAKALDSNKELNLLKKAFSELNLPAVQLNFQNILSSQYSNSQLKNQLLDLNKVLSFSKNINTVNVCELIELEKIRFDLNLHDNRLKLLQKYSDSNTIYAGSIYQLPNNKEWYQLLTSWWLGENISPIALKTIGENEFNKAHTLLKNVKRTHNDKTTASHKSQTIEKAYGQTENTVMKNLNKLFNSDWKFKPVNIEKSFQGNDFPAPGYYNRETDTFYYNPLFENYNLSQVDWLYIHEAIPGHHYQNKIAEKHSVCNHNLSTQPEMAFTEGWAAYTETLGKELGLYQDPNSQYFALKWQALRAMRVIIDVGIHAQGWSQEKAQSYWLAHFPEGEDVMIREIQRIQNWPMQVNTYVFGKFKIEQLKHKLKQDQGHHFNAATFHGNIVSLTRLPLVSLHHYSKLFSQQKQVTKDIRKNT